MLRPLLVVLGLLAACDGARVQGDADAFSLSITPRVFGTDPSTLQGTRLSIQRDEEDLDLGVDTDATWTWDPVAPFEDERLVMHWTSGDTVVARGVTPPLHVVDGSVTTDVWVLPPGELVAVADLTSLLAPLGAAAAITSDGDLWLMGGTRDVVAGPGQVVPASDAIWRIARDAEAPFPTLVGALSSSPGVSDPRVFPSITPVFVDDQELLLVLGGRPRTAERDGRDLALLVDPTSALVIGTFPTLEGFSEHRALPLDTHRVLRIGGFDSRGAREARWQVIDALARTATDPSPLPGTGGWWPAIAPHPDGGAVLCGGASGRDGETEHLGSAACFAVDPDASPPLRDLPALPTAIIGGAMAVLSDGTVLVTGGVAGPLEPDALAVASDTIWLLAPDAAAWVNAGKMARRRVHHRLIPLGASDVLAVGGVEATSGPPLLALGPGAGPAERIDVEAGVTRELLDTRMLDGAWPAVAQGSEGLLVVVQGASAPAGRTEGGEALGLLTPDP